MQIIYKDINIQTIYKEFLKLNNKKTDSNSKAGKGASLMAEVVKNLPASAGNTGWIPDLGRSHMPWSKEAHGPQLLSLGPRTRELQLLKPECLEPTLHNKRSQQ